jgi:mycothione reductase
MLVHPADVARAVGRAAHLGIDATVDKVRWTDIRDRVFNRIDPISAAGRHYRADRCRHITLYEGHARFTGPGELHIEGPDRALSADRIVIAAGSRPSCRRVVAESGVPFHTSDTVMRIDTLPERLIILGSGYIAAGVRARVLRVRLRRVGGRTEHADAARPGRDGVRAVHRAGPRPLGRAPGRRARAGPR